MNHDDADASTAGANSMPCHELTHAESLQERLATYALQARGAFAANTQRARRADWADFMAWCESAGHLPLPASPLSVAQYIDVLAAHKAPATIRRRVSTIATAHHAAQVDNPCGKPAVKLALARLQRNTSSRQKQATGLTWQYIEIILANLDDDLRARRDRALILVAYDTLLRRAELSQLRVDDLIKHADDSATILVRRSKSDPRQEGVMKWLAPTTVMHVSSWLDAAHIRTGALFRRVHHGGRLGEALSAEAIHRCLQRLARLAGLEGGVSGHSCRVGAAQDMVAAGIDLPAIMHAGSWKSPRMPARYAERLMANRSGMAVLAKKQGR
jgi:site-specific recombinase XerD